ncbi:FAD-dependent oxidoreductase [Solidesulfovibrio sp.]|uniref:NAD(P)/FAD-dependent oxidoreductase n=1 Tax=Solidesulfovibrio sp. TaxID=2910990 RepID=UPI0026200401|nr:FAD-dependent oxidoreductase [Solidesulfovibrio sp.]
MKPEHRYDCLIIGGGPAGMTAAVYAARAKLKAIVLESNITGGLVNSTYVVENFPSYPSIHGMELMGRMREHVDGLGVPVEEVCEIERLELAGEVKTAETDEAVYRAPAVILATGRKPVALDVPTECDQVHHCAICDGAPYAGKRVLVTGGGNSAFDESLYLLSLGVAHVTLVEIMPRFFAAAAAQEALFASGKAEGHTETRVVDLETTDCRLTAAVLQDVASGRTWREPVDGVFVFLGQLPNNALFKNQIELTKAGYIPAAPDASTSLPGVFAAGDIVDKPFRQITTAVADGTVAALSAERFLRCR